LENIIKIQYGTNLRNIHATYMLPNHMINFMRNVLFFNQIQSSADIVNEELRKELFDEINESLSDHFHIHSNGGIVKKIKESLKGKDIYYIMDRIYNKIYFQIESPPEKTDGDKKGEVYDKFSVNMSGFLEFYKPMTYLIKVPDIVGGHLIDDIVKVSKERDNQLDYMPTGFLPYQRKTVSKSKIIQDLKSGGYSILYMETEFLVEAGKDFIDILGWMQEEKFNGKYKDMIAYMKYLTNKEFNERFKFVIYAADTLKDELDIMYDKGILYLSNTDSTKLHTLYLLYFKNDVDHRLELFMKTKFKG